MQGAREAVPRHRLLLEPQDFQQLVTKVSGRCWVVLWCLVVSCVVLCCLVLSCVVLCCLVLCYVVLRCVVLCCGVRRLLSWPLTCGASRWLIMSALLVMRNS
jgi:hypothetical protein